jgi:uroporphyrinogen decarboxylase
MMSPATYRRWLKPRLKRVIDAARAEKPDIVVLYHSCGHVTGLIKDLVEAGIDVLNPVQPESMDFTALHREYGRDLSFNGTIGTQTVMPFGTPDEVRQAVRANLALAGPRGGLFACPTHLLEPEVPWENIEAYADACRGWTG